MNSTLTRGNQTIINEEVEMARLIKYYVKLEKSPLSRKQYAVKFSQAIAVNINKLYNGNYIVTNESKDYKYSMSRFNQVLKKNLNTSACEDYLDYFYRKFLEEIKEERYQVSGRLYSTNQKMY